MRTIESLFPETVAVAVWGADEHLPPLYPVEREEVSRSVEKRRAEFSKGRVCARRALRRLGISDGPIAVGPSRAPIWPKGIVGSITHCEGLVAAVAAHAVNEPAIGLDAEVLGALPQSLFDRVCTAKELEQIRESEHGLVDWHTLIFSAKESIHKALHPVTGIWLEFFDVELSIDLAQKRFSASPGRALNPLVPVLSSICGRFDFFANFVVTGVFIRSVERGATE